MQLLALCLSTHGCVVDTYTDYIAAASLSVCHLHLLLCLTSSAVHQICLVQPTANHYQVTAYVPLVVYASFSPYFAHQPEHLYAALHNLLGALTC